MGAHVRAVALLFAAVAIVLSGCGGSDSGSSSSSGSTTDNGVPDSDGRVPFEVLKAGIMAGNEGDYDKAATWVSPSGGMVGDNFQVWTKVTKNGTVKSVEKTSEDYSGQGVDVGYTIHFEDGSTKSDKAQMVKFDGKWKIDWLSTGF